MIKSIKSYFEELFKKQQENPATHERTIELATAVLMIEISLADDHIDDDERNMMIQILRNNFHITQEEISSLIEAA